MKKLILLLLTCTLVGCSSKGRVVEKKYYPAKIPEVSEEYTIVTDKSGNKNRIIVNKETYDKLSVGDVFD